MVMFLVILCMSFHAFPENLQILLAFRVPLDGWGGNPMFEIRFEAPWEHQIVNMSLVLKAYGHIGMVMFFMIFSRVP